VEVPLEILAFGELSGATSVRIPQTDGHFTAQAACIGEVNGRHGSDSRHLVVVWVSVGWFWRGGRGCVCV
jgi:hypothetical protein